MDIYMCILSIFKHGTARQEYTVDMISERCMYEKSDLKLALEKLSDIGIIKPIGYTVYVMSDNWRTWLFNNDDNMIEHLAEIFEV